MNTTPFLTKLHLRWQHGRARLADKRKLEQRSRVASILCTKAAPNTAHAEKDFKHLQSEFMDHHPYEYTYDGAARIERAGIRLKMLQKTIPELSERSLQVLDAGAGEAMFGVLLDALEHEVTLTDLDDWRMNKAKELSFLPHDCTQTFPDTMQNQFDLVTSFNSFEHFPDPQLAFSNLWDVLKPGGVMHLAFNPLYGSAWGLHAFGTLFVPYAQFLFSPAFLGERLRELGIKDLARSMEELQHLNQWKPQQFRDLWTDLPDGEVEKVKEQITDDHLNLIERYPDAFQGRELVLEDVRVSGFAVWIRKSL